MSAPGSKAKYRLPLGVTFGVLALGAHCFLAASSFLDSRDGVARCGAVPLGPQHREPCEVATRYFQAVASEDWAGALGYVSGTLRATTSADDLRHAWWQRGRVERFAINLDPGDQEVGAAIAFVDGTLKFSGKGDEHIVVYLVREQGAWKIGRLP